MSRFDHQWCTLNLKELPSQGREFRLLKYIDWKSVTRLKNSIWWPKLTPKSTRQYHENITSNDEVDSVYNHDHTLRVSGCYTVYVIIKTFFIRVGNYLLLYWYILAMILLFILKYNRNELIINEFIWLNTENKFP
jgi:hypothetical protein